MTCNKTSVEGVCCYRLATWISVWAHSRRLLRTSPVKRLELELQTLSRAEAWSSCVVKPQGVPSQSLSLLAVRATEGVGKGREAVCCVESLAQD